MRQRRLRVISLRQPVSRSGLGIRVQLANMLKAGRQTHGVLSLPAW